MTKFILIMFICSGIPGNKCKSMPTPVSQFDTYHECAYYGYDYSSELIKGFSSDYVDTYRMFTAFSCSEEKSI